VEHSALRAGPDLRRPTRARLDYRHAVDLDEDVELVEASRNGELAVSFVAGGVVKAVARVEQL
jgi:hypothetical protein